MTIKLRPKESLEDNARIATLGRLDEVLALADVFADETQVTRLHELRIAVKRLRYAIEIFELCFQGTKAILRELSAIQEALGTIHDFDVLSDLLRARLTVIDAELIDSSAEIMGSDRTMRQKSDALRGLLYAQARDARRRGTVGLLGDKIATRHQLFVEARDRWGTAGIEKLAARIRSMVEGPAAKAEREAESRPARETPEAAAVPSPS